MHGYSHAALGLSTYTATLYKKFGGSMDSGLILQLVAHQLKSFRSADLIILKELIAKTTQIQPQVNLTDDQVACMGGGTAIPCAWAVLLICAVGLVGLIFTLSAEAHLLHSVSPQSSPKLYQPLLQLLLPVLLQTGSALGSPL